MLSNLSTLNHLTTLGHITTEPFRGSDAVSAGLVTPGRLRGPEFVSLFRDVYVGSSVDVDVGVRVRAVSLRAGRGAVVAGPLAALAWNVDCPWDDAEAVAPGGRRLGREGIRLRTGRLARDEIATRFGVAVTSPERTAFDLARRDGALSDAVAAVDALAHACRFGRASIDRLMAAHPSVRGLVQARRVSELMDPRAESLPETRMRLLFLFRALPPPVPQHEVTLLNGRSVRLDLAWPDAKVAVEYDGDDHLDRIRHGKDLDRDLELARLGWYIVHVNGRQIYGRPDTLVQHVAHRLGL